MSTLGERIQARRMELGVTLPQLAEAAGRTPADLAQVERGERNVRSRELRAIAERLGTSVRGLLAIGAGTGRLAAVCRLEHTWSGTPIGTALETVRLALELEHVLFWLETPGSTSPVRGVPLPLPGGDPAQRGRTVADTARDALARDAAPIHDLTDFVEAFGVDVLHAPLPEQVSGVAVRAAGTSFLAVNSRCAAPDQRGALARLLGCAFLGDDELSVDEPGPPTDGVASPGPSACAFADHLLMPEDGLRRHVGGRSVDDAVFVDLLFTFGVEADALGDRLEACGLITAGQRREFDHLQSSDRESLAWRYGHLAAWRQDQTQLGLMRPPRRLWRRAVAAYEQGLIGTGPMSTLTNQDPEELELALGLVGVEPDFSDLHPRPAGSQ